MLIAGTLDGSTNELAIFVLKKYNRICVQIYKRYHKRALGNNDF